MIINDDQPGVHAHADLDVDVFLGIFPSLSDLIQRLNNSPARLNPGDSGILQTLRIPEINQQPVADVIAHLSSIAVDDLFGHVMVIQDHLPVVFRIHTFR